MAPPPALLLLLPPLLPSIGVMALAPFTLSRLLSGVAALAVRATMPPITGAGSDLKRPSGWIIALLLLLMMLLLLLLVVVVVVAAVLAPACWGCCGR
jgi:hypothetical protein